MLEIAFFDLDDTLYPKSSGYMQQIGINISRWVTEVLGYPPALAQATRKRWREQYGTALRGMMEEKIPFDREEFFRFVHDFSLDSMHPDPTVRNMLGNLPMRKAVLTNSNIEHAERVLQHLQLRDCFEQIIDIKALDYVNKPWPEAYHRALDMVGGVAPHKAMLIEDSTANTRTAKEMGMLTVLVDTPLSDDAHYFVDHVSQVGELVAKISRKDAKA